MEVLRADVDGYSRLMRDDEEATVRTITSYRTAMTHLIVQYRLVSVEYAPYYLNA